MKKEDGFIALISMLILSFVLLVAVLSLAQFGITSRLFLLDLENKSASEQLAYGCVQFALVRLISNPDDVISCAPALTIRSGECTIVSVGPIDGGFSRIQTSAEVSGATTNLEVVWNSNTEAVDSWKELASLTSCP